MSHGRRQSAGLSPAATRRLKLPGYDHCGYDYRGCDYRGEGSRISHMVSPGSLVTFTHPPYWLTRA